MAKSDDISSDNDYEAENDARVLKQHAEITGDPKRHAKAHAKLLEQTQSHQSALDASHKALRKRVARGLKQAFPANLNKPSPFEADSAKKTGSPFQQASEKD